MRKIAVVGAVWLAGVLGIGAGVDAPGDVLPALWLLWTIALLWISESLHITITALLVPVLAVAMGLLDMTAAMASFAHPIIFLFLGGFALAAAMREQGLDRWLAGEVLRLTRGRFDLCIYSLAAATAVLSMWISNSAVTAVMLPLVIGLIGGREGMDGRTQAYCLLAIAYSANIGGMGTLIGTPPNALVAAELGLSFSQWLVFGVPLVALLWPLAMVALKLVLRPDFGDNQVAEIQSRDFAWTLPRQLMIAIFALTVAGWLLGQPLARLLGIEGNIDTWVALMAIVLLAITRVVSWKDIERSAEWGVLLLFGGGLALSAVLRSAGASEYLGLGLADIIGGWPLFFLLLALVGFVIFLTEVSSNTATTALLLPIFVALPGGFIDPTDAALAIGLSASCAFMLPVATPPNALVHGTGRVPQAIMVRAGFVLNLVCIGALTTVLVLW